MQLTLYPNGTALIHRPIIIDLKEGINEITINNIPDTIDDHNIIFNFLDSDNVFAKSYEFTENEGELLLNVIIIANESKEYSLDLVYTIKEIFNETFYTVIYDIENKTITIHGWLEIQNQSGKDFKNIELKNICSENNNNIIFYFDDEQNIENKQKSYISFISKKYIPFYKKYLIAFDHNHASEYIVVNNTIDNNLGVTFMAGEISLYQQNQDSVIYIGSEKMDVYLPDDTLFFISNTIENKVNVIKQTIDDLYIINLQNLTHEIIDIEVEINTFRKNIKKTNVEFYIDNNGIGHVDLKLSPLSNYKIVYQLETTDLSETL